MYYDFFVGDNIEIASTEIMNKLVGAAHTPIQNRSRISNNNQRWMIGKFSENLNRILYFC